jgi:hypothetical protein
VNALLQLAAVVEQPVEGEGQGAQREQHGVGEGLEAAIAAAAAVGDDLRLIMQKRRLQMI